MTYEEFVKSTDELLEMIEQYEKGELEDDWTPEQRAAWLEKCNA